MTGHLLGAAGAVGTDYLHHGDGGGLLHPTVGLRESEPELDLDYCKQGVSEEVPFALSNSLGFGGHNASLLVGKYRE